MTERRNFLATCSFCAARVTAPELLFVGPEVSICETCVDLCVRVREERAALARRPDPT